MRALGIAALAVAVPWAGCSRLSAAVPEQFRVWGSAGPESPPVPEGWTPVPAAPEARPALVPTAEEEQRGYVLFARDPLAAVDPEGAPAPSERAAELVAFAARGQYEPLSFGLYALRALAGLGFEVGELRSADGAVIGSDQIDLRIVRCVRTVVSAQAKTFRLEPLLLEKRDSLTLEPNTATRVWLTVKVPEDAPPGEYVGSVTVKSEGAEPTAARLLLRVLPFALPPPSIEMSMFYARVPQSDGLLRQELIDQREHGMNVVDGAVAVEVASRDQHFGDDDVAATQARCRRLMSALREVYGGWHFPVNLEVGHQIAYYWDPGRGWFAFWPHAPEIEADLLRATEVVTDLAKADGWPPLRVYALDEAGAHNLLDEAVYYYGLIRQRRPDLTTWTTIGGGMAMGHDEIGQLSPVVDFLSTNRFTPEIAQALVARGKPYGIYNGAGPTAAGARLFFGFYGWKTRAQQIEQWAYSFGEGIFQGTGLRAQDEGYVYHAPDGPLPSLMWEAVRQGVDDYRYLDLLWQRTAARKGSPEAAAAEKVARDILATIPWTFQAVAYEDRTPPPHPSTLRKWRWQVAQQIMALGEGAPTESASAAPPSPLDFAWATAAEGTVVYGDELLPPSDFETDLKPWRIEAWKGQGVGELDPAVAHGSAQSVRVSVPAEDGNEAVTVLVWPTWGGGGLDLVLQGDHTYEFSAWVRLKDRAALPDLRVNLPEGAARSTRTGRDAPDAAGWQRAWVRVELAHRAQPTYLAAWVQGPGTVWLDDLRLREVIPPPLDVRLDQGEYDDLDRLAVATVTISRLAAPARVRLALLAEGGAVAASLTAPFLASASVTPSPDTSNGRLTLMTPATMNDCRFVFDPSKLPPGGYQARAELLDAAGSVSAGKAARFERPAG